MKITKKQKISEIVRSMYWSLSLVKEWETPEAKEATWKQYNTLLGLTEVK